MIEKSKGHLGFVVSTDGTISEVYSYGGNLHVAPLSNVIDLDSGCRFGRWEGPESFRAYILRMLGGFVDPVAYARLCANYGCGERTVEMARAEFASQRKA